MSTEAMKLALDDLIAEYHMENSSFAKRVDDIFKEALVEQPAQRKPLTDEQRCTIIKQECRYTSCAATEDHHRLIQAIETFHGIKE